MDKILGNKFLIANALTYEFSKKSSEALDYDYFSVYDDIVRSVKADLTSKNLDRRAVATGSDHYTNAWNLLSGTPAGWKETMYIIAGMYAQMIIDLVQPTSSLIVTPDRGFDVALDLNRKGVAQTFVNNDCLQTFEEHVLPHPDYTFTGDYTVIEVEELEAMTAPQFDFVAVSSVDLTINPDLIGSLIDATNPGGCIYISAVNESMRLYSADYYIEPLYDLFEALDGRTDITSYHIPHATGFQIVVKQ